MSTPSIPNYKIFAFEIHNFCYALRYMLCLNYNIKISFLNNEIEVSQPPRHGDALAIHYYNSYHQSKASS
jgi:hypothetical protein